MRIRSAYSYGFQGQERLDEISGSGNNYSFGDYGLDTRLGRRWNVDPMEAKAPGWSSYRVFFDNPIMFVDPSGLFEDDWQLNDDKSLTRLKRTDDKTHNIFNTDGKLIKSTHMDREDFANQHDLELNVGKWLNGVADFQTALTRDENLDAFNDMSQRAKKLDFQGGATQMKILQDHGNLNNTDNIIKGVLGTLTANPITAFKGKNASGGLGGGKSLYEGLTKGNNLFDDIKSFSIRTYDDFTKGAKQFYYDFSRELNKGQDINTYR